MVFFVIEVLTQVKTFFCNLHYYSLICSYIELHKKAPTKSGPRKTHYEKT
jgi:hypothetical protein